MDDQLKKLVKELGEAINQAVADSEPIAEVMSRIKASGHDAFLALEATIGFTQHADTDADADAETLQRKTRSTGELEITSQDLQFLRSLRIAVNDEK